MLVPLIDMINHAPDANVIIGRDVSTGAFAAQATCNISAGEQVAIPSLTRSLSLIPHLQCLGRSFWCFLSQKLLAVAANCYCQCRI